MAKFAPASELSAAAQQMWDDLEFVPYQKLKDAMIAANVPGCQATSWKIDLINLAVTHSFTYVFAQRFRLTKAVARVATLDMPALLSPVPQSPSKQLVSSAAAK